MSTTVSSTNDSGSVSSAGVGSGLDVKTIVSGLVKAESSRLDSIKSKENDVNTQITNYGQLKSAVSDFDDAMKKLSKAKSLELYKSSSSDENVLTVSTDSNASKGNYLINVEQLAKANKIAYTVANPDATIGSGNLTISVGSKSFDVSVASSDKLSDIADKINSASDNAGVTAAVVNTDSGARLVFSADNTGTANQITVTATDQDGNNTDTSGLSALASNNAETVTAAQDAKITIDGATVTSSSNNISSAVSGVSFTAKSLGSTTVNVTRDDDSITEAIQGFADAYNSLKSKLDSLGNGPLKGDTTVSLIKTGLQNILNTGTAIGDSDYSNLAQIGVSTAKDGTMKVDKDAVSKALDTNFSSVVNLFSSDDGGIAKRFDGYAGDLLADNGAIAAGGQSLKSTLDSWQDQEAREQYRIDLYKTRITKQYNSLDTLVSSLKGQGNALMAQLDSLSKSLKG